VQSLAVVYFPNINSSKINNFRRKYDPNWKIIPPHITLVSPLSDIPEDQLLKHVEEVIRYLKAFPINLAGLTKSFDDYLFLLVKEGNDEIMSLHDKLYSGMLVNNLPKDVTFVPHLTLGYFRKDNHFHQELFERTLEEAGELDISCIFDSVTIIKGDELTPAKIIRTFKLK